jgi:hypothetical protein
MCSGQEDFHVNMAFCTAEHVPVGFNDWRFIVWCTDRIEVIPKTEILQVRRQYSTFFIDQSYLTGDDLDGHASICIKKVRGF